MNKKIKITEGDLFKFVFSPGDLSLKKKEHIEKNMSRYNSFINVLQEDDKKLQQRFLDSIKDEIIGRISSNKRTSDLFPNNIDYNTTAELKLAASTAELSKSIHTVTFSDKDSKYLIRIVYELNQTLLFFFPISEIKFPVRLTFSPGNTEYVIHTPEKPIRIREEFSIEKINVEEILFDE